MQNGIWCGRRDLNPGSQAWKACVLNQLDDDRPSDTVVLETKKAIDSTLTMLTNAFFSRTLRGSLTLRQRLDEWVCFYQL